MCVSLTSSKGSKFRRDHLIFKFGKFESSIFKMEGKKKVLGRALTTQGPLSFSLLLSHKHIYTHILPFPLLSLTTSHSSSLLLSLSLSHSLTLLGWLFDASIRLNLRLCVPLACKPSHTLSHTQTLIPSLTFSHSLTFFHTHSRMHKLTHTHAHTTLSRTPLPFLSPSIWTRA